MFLLRYVGLTSTADVAALDMYRDDARVRVAAMIDGRTTQPGTIDGKQWKQQLRAGWFDGTTRLEASSFAGATVETEGSRLLIRARRYSHTRCYWDNSYAVTIEPDRTGQLQIVEERITFQRSAVCPSATQQASQQMPGTPSALAAAEVNAATAVPAVTKRAALPPNIVPSGQGMPHLPPPNGPALNAVAPPPAPAPSRLGAPVNQPQ
jgi:hypothetical protein